MKKIEELSQNNLEAWQIGQNDLNLFQEELRENREVVEQDFLKDNEGLIKKINNLSEEQDIEKSHFKEQALKLFETTKEKKLIGGLGIREGTNLIYDSEEAFAWAKEHSLCLQLNSKEFEKIAKTQEIEFVKKETKITVTFPSMIKVRICFKCKKSAIDEPIEFYKTGKDHDGDDICGDCLKKR